MRSRTSSPLVPIAGDVLRRDLHTIDNSNPPIPGTPVPRVAGAAVPGVGEGFDLYVPVTRKGSLTNETNQGIRR